MGIWKRVGVRVEMENGENCMRSECGNELNVEVNST